MFSKIATAALLASTAAALPAGAPADSPTCTSKVASLNSWTVKDFDYHQSYTFTTPAHQNSHGDVSFSLFNPALEGTAVGERYCSAYSTWLDVFFLGEIIYKCHDKDGKPVDDTTFTYSRPTQQLMINQTWTCDDNGAQYFAQGGVKLDLKCNETKYKNDNWKMGEIYSDDTTVCDKVTTEAKIDSMQAIL